MPVQVMLSISKINKIDGELGTLLLITLVALNVLGLVPVLSEA